MALPLPPPTAERTFGKMPGPQNFYCSSRPPKQLQLGPTENFVVKFQAHFFPSH